MGDAGEYVQVLKDAPHSKGFPSRGRLWRALSIKKQYPTASDTAFFKIPKFFFSLAKNQFQSRQRRRWRSAEQLDATTPDACAVEPDLLRRLDYLSLLQQIHTLPELTREVMYLRLFGQLSFQKIGGDVLELGSTLAGQQELFEKLNLVNDHWYSADARPIIDFSVSVE